jgi:phosphatidylinositol phospholipase C delta
LDLDDFQVFVRRMRERKEIASLAERLAGNSDGLSLNAFASFLRKEQRSSLRDGPIELLFTKYSISEPLDRLSAAEFTNFLASADNSPFPRDRALGVTQDMSRPLCEYFISSSHNVRRRSPGCAPC